MSETVSAVYVDGTLKLERPLEGLENHSKVQVIVVAQPGVSKHPLEDCIGTMSDEDAQEMKRIMSAEFDQVDPDDWK
jgi:hypothetical protein